MSSSSEQAAEYDEKVMRTIILKLLDKAGTDKRLTLRILRNKTEEKMKLQKGILKEKREMIKSLTYKWWKVNQTNSNNTATESAKPTTTTSDNIKSSSSTSDSKTVKTTSEEWKQLATLAKAVGKGIFIKTMDEHLSEKEKSLKLRKKLRDLDLKFSDIPTNQEIEKLKKSHEAKSSLTSTGTASKSSNNSNTGSSSHADTKVSTSTSNPEIKKRKLGETSSSSSSTAEVRVTATTKSESKGTDGADSSSAPNPAKVKRVIYDSDEEVGDF